MIPRGHYERIAYAIVPVEVHYPDRVVRIALLLWSMQYAVLKDTSWYSVHKENSVDTCICTLNDSSDMYSHDAANVFLLMYGSMHCTLMKSISI